MKYMVVTLLFIFLPEFASSQGYRHGVYFKNVFDLNYNLINPRHYNTLYHNRDYRNYSDELLSIYGDVDPDYKLYNDCASKFGCNLFSPGKIERLKEEARSKARNDIKRFETNLKKRLDEVEGDLQRVAAGGLEESTFAKGMFPKLRAKLGSIESINKRMSDTLASAEDIFVSAGSNVRIDPDDLKKLNDSFTYDPLAEKRLRAGHEENLKGIDDLVYTQISQGRLETAKNLLDFRNRLDAFIENGEVAPVSLDDKIYRKYPKLGQLDSSDFYDNDSIRISNAFLKFDPDNPSSLFWERMIVEQISPWQEGTFNSRMEGSLSLWRIVSELSIVQGTIGLTEGIYGVAEETVEGVIQLVSSPIETAKGMYRAIVEYEKTWASIRGYFEEHFENLENCSDSPRKCGNTIGIAASEVGLAYLTAGAAQAVSKSAKVSKAISVSKEALKKKTSSIAENLKKLKFSKEQVGRLFESVDGFLGCVRGCQKAAFGAIEVLLEAGWESAEGVISGAGRVLGSATNWGYKTAEGMKEFVELMKRPFFKNPESGSIDIDLLNKIPGMAEKAGIPTKIFGRVQSRINLANGNTRFTPIRQGSGEPVSAGFKHILEGHFDRPLANSRSIFSVTPDELKTILQSRPVVGSPVSALGDGPYRQYVRTVDTGQVIGNTALKFGGNPTSKITIFSDEAGNIITTYPVP